MTEAAEAKPRKDGRDRTQVLTRVAVVLSFCSYIAYVLNSHVVGQFTKEISRLFDKFIL